MILEEEGKMYAFMAAVAASLLSLPCGAEDKPFAETRREAVENAFAEYQTIAGELDRLVSVNSTFAPSSGFKERTDSRLNRKLTEAKQVTLITYRPVVKKLADEAYADRAISKERRDEIRKKVDAISKRAKSYKRQ